jgi:hypothetical protein
MLEDKTAFAASDWTPAPSEPAVRFCTAQLAYATDQHEIRALSAASPSASLFKNALSQLQKRPIVKSSTLVLVWHLIVLSICSVAYDLLD